MSGTLDASVDMNPYQPPSIEMESEAGSKGLTVAVLSLAIGVGSVSLILLGGMLLTLASFAVISRSIDSGQVPLIQVGPILLCASGLFGGVAARKVWTGQWAWAFTLLGACLVLLVTSEWLHRSVMPRQSSPPRMIETRTDSPTERPAW